MCLALKHHDFRAPEKKTRSADEMDLDQPDDVRGTPPEERKRVLTVRKTPTPVYKKANRPAAYRSRGAARRSNAGTNRMAAFRVQKNTEGDHSGITVELGERRNIMNEEGRVQRVAKHNAAKLAMEKRKFVEEMKCAKLQAEMQEAEKAFSEMGLKDQATSKPNFGRPEKDSRVMRLMGDEMSMRVFAEAR